MDSPLRLLMVEDSETDATLLQQALRNGGYDVSYAIVDTPAAMRAALEGRDWDVITSDHAMPQFSAPAALSLAKQLVPDLPFIIVSGEIDLNLAVSLMRQGAQDFIQKAELIRLVPTIERELRDRELRRDRQRTKAALEVSEVRYRRLFETARDGILIIDADTAQILDVNPFLSEMLGYGKEEFLGKKLWEIGAFRDTQASRNAFTELQRNGYVRYEDLPLQTIGDKLVNVEFVGNVYSVDHTNVAQCNIRDIAARRQADEQIRVLNADLEQRVRQRTAQLEELIEELETFSYSVSHDLRAPLRHITAFADILQDNHAGQQTAESLQVIHTIRSSAQRMNELIDALLRLARLSGGEFRRRPVDLSAVVRRIAGDLQQGDSGRNVRFSIAEGVTANGDDQLLAIALENLLSNAWKFTSKRDGAHIEFGSAPHADGSATYFVRDNGAGFDALYADRMFGAFKRLHSEKEFPGIGIGLATVKRIIHRHGGKVWAEGIVSTGSTFYFSIPGGSPQLGIDSTA